MSTRRQVSQPGQSYPVPVLDLVAGDFIVDQWDYIWRVKMDVADTPLVRGKVIVYVQQISVEDDEITVAPLTYSMDFAPEATERKYTEAQVKEMVK